MQMHELLSHIDVGCCYRSVLATIIEVRGHAYRKQGASMLLFESGDLFGSLSPGCIESDLIERVSDVLATGKPQTAVYDSREVDDLSWGEVLGCGGMIRILLEPVGGELYCRLTEMKCKLNDGWSVRFIRRFGSMPFSIEYDVVTLPWDRWSKADVMNAAGGICEFDYYPAPRLIVFGAGNDAQPLVELASSTGFRVVVADWRIGLCTQDRFPGAQRFVGFPEHLWEQLQVSERDYVVIMSHQFQRDLEFLHLAISNPLRYLGIMGSKERTEKMLKGHIPPKWVQYPAGMPIGAQGPAQIAVSIVAELIRVSGNAQHFETIDVGYQRKLNGA